MAKTLGVIADPEV